MNSSLARIRMQTLWWRHHKPFFNIVRKENCVYENRQNKVQISTTVKTDPDMWKVDNCWLTLTYEGVS